MVSGYRLSKNVVSGINKIENNTYNGEINYVVNGSNDDAFVVSYDRSKMTNAWASLVLWYDAAMNATTFELEFEVTKGSLPVMQFEFGGESSFKQYQRYVVKPGKNSVSLNTTDVDLDGEGSWKAIYLELNNPCPLEGTTDETKGETEIKFTKIAMVAGEKQAPVAPGYVEVKDGVVYWEHVFAASAYELEVDGNTINDLMQRTRPSGDAPMMCRAYKPTEEKAFTVGKHNAKIRSKNSAGVSEWKEFTFTVAASSQETAETFRGITGQGRKKFFILGAKNAVYEVIGAHYRSGRRFFNDNFKRFEIYFPERSFRHSRIGKIPSVFDIVTRKMLYATTYADGLQPVYESRAEFSAYDGIFRIVLEISSAKRRSFNVYPRT